MVTNTMNKRIETVWSILRILLGWTFMWAFIDKTFGIGFATKPGLGWVDGGSPTYGFLMHATKGPFAELFQSLAGNALVEVVFMAGLLFVGLTLLLGIMVRLGAAVGFVMYLSFFTAGFLPPEHNPIIDEHVINAVIMIGLFITVPSTYLGFGKKWKRRRIVQRHPLLQ